MRFSVPTGGLVCSAEMYGSSDANGDLSVPATFEVLHFIAWKPGGSQPQPAERGSGTVSLRELGSVVGSPGS